MTYAGRRARNVALLVLAGALLWVWYDAHRRTLGDPRVFTGWLLLGLVAFLTLYNVRKKLPFLPLGRSATWLQLHAYAGVFAGFLFCFHIAFAAPGGTFNVVLFTLFVVVAGSGVLGLALSRWIPPRLTRRGEEVIFERIPGFRRVLRERAEDVVLRSVGETRSSAIADFYGGQLAPFFAGSRHFVAHVFESGAPLRRLRHELAELRGALRAEDAPFLDELGDLVEAKDELDYHFANQAVLKYWFFFHLPLTYALILFSLAHVTLVHAFGAVR